MASGAFFDPFVVMRVAPVLTSTLAMRFSHDQWFFLNTFNQVAPEHRAKANEIIPSYFTSFFMRGIWDIGVFYTLTPTWGFINFCSKPNGAWKWYAAGTAFSVLHLAFAPLVMYQVKGLSEDEPKGQGYRLLNRWLAVHVIRSWVADIPAWACFVIGCLRSLQPKEEVPFMLN